MESLFRYKCSEAGYAELAFVEKWLFFFWKSISSEELLTSKKDMFRTITNSEEVAPPKQ